MKSWVFFLLLLGLNFQKISIIILTHCQTFQFKYAPAYCTFQYHDYILRQSVTQTIDFAMYSFQLRRNRNNTKQNYKIHLFLLNNYLLKFIKDITFGPVKLQLPGVTSSCIS